MSRVAVVPFSNLTGTPRAGLAMSGYFAEAYRGRTKTELLAAETVRAVLAPHEGEVLAPETLGELLDVPAVVVGEVTEYRYKQGLGEKPAVGLSVRLVATADGRVLWSGSRASVGTVSLFFEDGLARLGMATCERLVGTIPQTAVE